jgi:hypothetical protein
MQCEIQIRSSSSIEKLEKDGLAKILEKNFVVGAVTSSTVKKTHSQSTGGMGEALPI